MITIIGGDFTRSWLSLPLSHGIKVKGKINFYGGFYREKLLKSVAFPFAKYLCWFGLSKTILGRQSMMTGHKTHIRGYIISVFRYKHRFLALFFMRSFIPTTDW